MGMYKNIKKTLINEYKDRSDVYKNKLSEWSKEPSVSKIKRPTNLPRARNLGYKAKEGIMIARVRVRKGNRKRATVGGGRKPSKSGRYFSRSKSLQSIAEERAAKKFTNFEILNSYFAGEIGTHRFYEVIMLDKNGKVLLSDRKYSSILKNPHRAERGLTSSGRKHRGI